MAYPNYKYEVHMTTSNETITTSGNKGNGWMPGLVPHIIRGFSVTLVCGCSPVDEQVVLNIVDLSSGSTASQVVALELTSDHDGGDVVYTATLDQRILPGQRVIVNVPTAATGVSGDFHRAIIYVEVSPEVPGNTSDMVLTSAT